MKKKIMMKKIEKLEFYKRIMKKQMINQWNKKMMDLNLNNKNQRIRNCNKQNIK